jgi:hypothetical protein
LLVLLDLAGGSPELDTILPVNMAFLAWIASPQNGKRPGGCRAFLICFSISILPVWVKLK